MFSRRIIFAAVVAAAIAGAVPAHALSTVTVTAGSAPSGATVAVTSTSASAIGLKDLTTNATGSCTSSSLTGTTKAGANSPANAAQINGGSNQVKFNSCGFPGGWFAVAINGVGATKWTLAATGTTTSGTTPIKISGINLAFDSLPCSFDVSGSVPGSFVNGSPSKITVSATTAATSQLVVSNIQLKGSANHCLGGAVTNTSPGNKFSLSGTYSVSATNSAYNPVTVNAS